MDFPQAERRRALILPREHGAWGILLVPLVTGAAVGLLRGGRVFPALLFTTAVVALFWLRTPVESWLGTSPVRAQTSQERRLVLRAIGARQNRTSRQDGGANGGSIRPNLNRSRRLLCRDGAARRCCMGALAR